MPRKKKEMKPFRVAEVESSLEDYEEGDDEYYDEPEAPIVQKMKPSKRHVEQYSLTEELLNLDRTIPQTAQGRASCLGTSAMTYPSSNNSMRSNMFTSHMNQFLNLVHPDVPYMFTTAENVAGKHSTSYYKTKSDIEIVRKIVKFEGLVPNPQVYTLFIYDKKKDRYDVIERHPSENLVENFGYEINNDKIDSLMEGDEVDAGTVLYKSKSYDEFMNYGYGLNVNVQYTLNPFTAEDAAQISESLANRMVSIENEVIPIKLNDNDFLLNMYGDDDNYKVIPDVGEFVNGKVLAASRRLYNDQIFYDFKKKNLSRLMSGDTRYYVDGKYEVMDITIYSNNEEIRDTVFNDQINRYLRAQNEYYKEIRKTCEKIRESGSSYSGDLDYLYKRAGDMLDTKKRWKENDSAFSNMLIMINVKNRCGLRKGQKVTGRYGNKSVASVIVPDSAMPYTADGRRVDLRLNLLAIINRTTAGPINEILITSIMYKARQQMAIAPTLELKEHILFSLLKDFNPTYHDEMYATYQKLSEKGKEKYLAAAITEGIFLHEKPMYAETYLFDRLLKIINKYDWILKDDIYINKYGRLIRTQRKEFIGQMYLMKLKQSDRRGYSSRNTGAVDITGLPTRRYKSRSHLEQTSSTAIRFGEYESLNFLIGLLPSDIAIFHSLYRTSIKGRGDLLKAVVTNRRLGPSLDDVYVSRVAEIFKVKMKSLGIDVEFVDEDDDLLALDDNVVTAHRFKGKEIVCTNYQFFVLQQEDKIREEVLTEYPCIMGSDLTREIQKRIDERFYITNIKYNEDGTLLLNSIGKDF